MLAPSAYKALVDQALYPEHDCYERYEFAILQGLPKIRLALHIQ